jgi:hypothetical protein
MTSLEWIIVWSASISVIRICLEFHIFSFFISRVEPMNSDLALTIRFH